MKDLTKIIDEQVAILDQKFTLELADGNHRKLPQHDFVLAEIKQTLTTTIRTLLEADVERLNKSYYEAFSVEAKGFITLELAYYQQLLDELNAT